jgi:hypothetical protein
VEVISLDRERAETHLRRIGETELRQATGQPQQGGRGGQRVKRVARALRAVEAIDQVTVDAFLADFELALTARRPGALAALARRSGGTAFHGAYRSGQLTALYDQLGFEHGITPAPASPVAASELPEAWRSVLDYRALGHRQTADPGTSFAALAAALPGLDGTTLTLLGLHNHHGETFLHIHVKGLWEPTDDYLAALPLLLWLRDDAGGWHTLDGSGSWSTHGGWSTHGDEMTARASVVPPLPHSATLEIIATGLSAEARMTVPLQWG